MNRHLPLLDLLFGLQNPKPRTDIFNLPFCYYNNLPPLHLASRVGDVETIQLLFQTCNAKKIDDGGRTALHHAADVGHLDVARVLLKKRLSLKAKDDKGQTPLHLAAANGHVQMVLEFATQAGINTKDNAGRTPLFLAAENGHEEVIQELYGLGAPIDAKDNKKRTALLVAAGNGHEAAVEALVQLGAHVNARDDDGRTALSRAAEGGHEVVAKLLLSKASIDRGISDKDGHTPLWWADKNGHQVTYRNLLLESGDDQPRKGDPEECKVLILGKYCSCSIYISIDNFEGSSDSGKSTIIKQIKIHFQGGYTKDELAHYRPTVYMNVVDSAKLVISAIRLFDMELTEKNKKYSDFLMGFCKDPDPDVCLGVEFGEAISSLWNDPIIPQVMERRVEFYLPDSAP
jgi:ankyrin repeat protein